MIFVHGIRARTVLLWALIWFVSILKSHQGNNINKTISQSTETSKAHNIPIHEETVLDRSYYHIYSSRSHRQLGNISGEYIAAHYDISHHESKDGSIDIQYLRPPSAIHIRPHLRHHLLAMSHNTSINPYILIQEYYQHYSLWRKLARKEQMVIDNHIDFKEMSHHAHKIWNLNDKPVYKGLYKDKHKDQRNTSLHMNIKPNDPHIYDHLYTDQNLHKKSVYFMLSLFTEIFYFRLSSYFTSTYESDSNGFYIQSANVLEERLTEARAVYQRDCRRNHSLLYMCLITKYDAIDLQEWVVWQLFIVGAHHIIIYLNDPRVDNTEQVLQPFIEAGYVTIFTNFLGPGQQNFVYHDCYHRIRDKSCHFNPFPSNNLTWNSSSTIQDFKNRRINFTNHFLETPSCKNENFDSYQGSYRPVWLSGFDSDEFTTISDNSCFIDKLPLYSKPNTKYRGLVVPWYNFGHSNILLSQRHVVSVYRSRTYRTKIAKTYNRLFYITGKSYKNLGAG